MPTRQAPTSRHPWALLITAALHAALGVTALGIVDPHVGPRRSVDTPAADVLMLEILPAPRAAEPEPPGPRPVVRLPEVPLPEPPRVPVREPATQAAPPPPTAEEWAFASRYALKNSKGYRYHWGQHVRSQMGTAVEGPDQGLVRFRVEIAPDGTLARLDTLWTTSPVAEQKARDAITRLPRLPPTPTGLPLVFERTIAFTPGADDGPPVYRDDCLPDPPAFRNPFVWDGRSEPPRATPQTAAKPDPQALADCLRQLPADTVEAEAAHDRRLREQWDPSLLRR